MRNFTFRLLGLYLTLSLIGFLFPFLGMPEPLKQTNERLYWGYLCTYLLPVSLPLLHALFLNLWRRTPVSIDEKLPPTLLYALPYGFIVVEMALMAWDSLNAFPADMTQDDVISLYWPVIAGIGIVYIPVAITVIKAFVNEHPLIRRWFHFHKGNSSIFGGLYTFWMFGHSCKFPFDVTGKKKKRRVFLGRPVIEDRPTPNDLYLFDQSHIVTFGMTGAGKSATVLYNNISGYEGNLFVLDPKGELSRYGYATRDRTDYILDPMNENQSKGFGCKTVRYNPLDEIDVNSDKVVSYIEAVAKACVVEGNGGDSTSSYFNGNAKDAIAAMIAHVKTTYPKRCHNLPYIFDLALGKSKKDGTYSLDNFEALLEEMLDNKSHLRSLIVKSVTTISDAGRNEYGSLMNTLKLSLKWVTEPPMREHLSHSDFSMTALTREKCSIFVVLPFNDMKEDRLSRYMRVLTVMATNAVKAATKKPDPPVLFILDEFAALGKFPAIKSCFSEMRGYGAKFWILMQGLGQLESLYGKENDEFIGNSNVQLLASNSDSTLEWASKRLGKFQHTYTKGWLFKKVVMREDARDLMAAREVSEFLTLDHLNQIVFPAGGLPMKLKAVFYKHLVPKKIRNL